MRHVIPFSHTDVSLLAWDNQVFQLPSALAYPLFYKLAQPGASTVSLHAVQSWIMQRNVMQVCQDVCITQLQCTCRVFCNGLASAQKHGRHCKCTGR